MRRALSIVGDVAVVAAMSVVLIAADVVYCGIDLVAAYRRGPFPRPRGSHSWTK